MKKCRTIWMHTKYRPAAGLWPCSIGRSGPTVSMPAYISTGQFSPIAIWQCGTRHQGRGELASVYNGNECKTASRGHGPNVRGWDRA